MLLDPLINNIEYNKISFVRTDGKLRRVKTPVEIQQNGNPLDRPLFPISKERK